jgi:ribose transport system ATP-binding protein
MNLLQLSGIRKSFGATRALTGVDLEVRRGEVHALVGENGAGKSTLMNILSGMLRPDEGTMRLDDREYRPAGPQEARRKGIAHIHQELSNCPHLSVAENILLGIEPSNFGWIGGGLMDWPALRSRSLEILRDFHHPAITPERKLQDLPLAAQQIVEICRALAQNAALILMDEPTSSLQREDVERLFACIRRLRDAGIAIIYISHFLEEVREIADRFTVLRDGASVMNGSLASAADAQIVTAMVGRPVETLFPVRAASRSMERVLEVRHLSAPPAVREASFELYRGEVLGIAGLVGSGRTRMIRSLLGLLPANTGEIVVGEELLAARGQPSKLNALMKRGLGYLSEDRKGEGLALELSVADNATITNLASCSRWGWLDRHAQSAQTETWIQKLRIKVPSPEAAVAKLSGGNQQKVAIARLLHQGARIILMDEPTRGVDIGSKAHIYEAIAEISASGKSVLMVSSYLPELFGMCDRIAVMVRGVLSPARLASEWTAETLMQVAIGSAVTGSSEKGFPS